MGIRRIGFLLKIGDCEVGRIGVLLTGVFGEPSGERTNESLGYKADHFLRSKLGTREVIALADMATSLITGTSM